MIIKALFWLLMLGVFYAYILYPLLLWALSSTRKTTKAPSLKDLPDKVLPEMTLFIPAYNEMGFIDEKIANSRALNYPRHLLRILWVTDGSDDGTPEYLRGFPGMEVLHENRRNGKIGAMNRGMQYVHSPVVVFTDANTYLGRETLMEIAARFQDERVGCVAGEKRIEQAGKADAVSSGEGIYWRYESWIKQLEATLGSVVGAAGELFAIRRELYQPIAQDTLLDDFVISMRIAMQGYHVKYSPRAYALERASVNIPEEMKRKVRIAAGGFQTLFRLKGLLNVFRHKYLSLAYFSHKVLRWIFVPLALPLMFVFNATIVLKDPSGLFYSILLVLQVLFYLAALLGSVLQKKLLSNKWFFVPYYICIMNWAMYLGFFRYIRRQFSVNWERARRV